MKLWLCGFALAFATFAHIETKPHIEEPSVHHIHTRGLDDVNIPFSSPPFSAVVPGVLCVLGVICVGYEIDKEEQEDFKTIDVTINGRYFWERIYYYDNRGQNNTYLEERTVTKKISTSYTELTKSVYDASIKISHSMEGGGKFEIISLSVKNSIDVELSSSYEKTVERKTTIEKSEELKRKFEVRPVPMLREIRVVYTSQSIERPPNVITETFGTSPDINAGFSGDYVWLVPVWTLKKDLAVTGIQVVVQSESNDAYSDVASGAGDKYRYLKMLRDSFSNTKIKRVGLLRSPKSTYIYGDRQKHGWDECTEDINQDRKGDWLHLCWNIVSTSYTF